MPRKERREANRADKRQAKRKRARNKEFARVTYVFVTLFLVMMGYIVYFNLTQSQEFIKSPYNQRKDMLANKIERGKILDKSGKVLAQTKPSKEGKDKREYPYGNMFAHVVGYTEQGKIGLESEENTALLTSNIFFLEKFSNQFKNKKNPGDNVVTTLDAEIQEAAYDALGDSKGAIVVIEPSTGKILAMVSKPDFDPNTVAEDWEELNADEDAVLLNRATQGMYTPGSAFKVVTTLDFMRENPDYQEYSYECSGEIQGGKNTIHCFNGRVHGEVDLRDSIAYSCNTSFCNIGNGLNISDFQSTAKDLLFNSKLPSELPYKKSSFALKEGAGEAERMMTAMGQGQTQVSPYHMALITASIANDGVLMKPYMIDSVVSASGTIISQNKPKAYKELMSGEEAEQLKDYMFSVVDYGTATVLSESSYTVAGKTGTAEYSTADKAKDHSWFIGMSNIDDPDMVISVVIEAADGTSKAVNVAKKVFDSYYGD